MQDYYKANRADYIRPERRVLRYVPFDIERGGRPATGDSRRRSPAATKGRRSYPATEERSFTQLVVPTEAAAQAVIDEVSGGVSLEASARSKGLSTISLSAGGARNAGFAVLGSGCRTPGFGGDEGALVGPVRGELGWYVLRVDDVTQVSGQTVDRRAPTIREKLQEERRALALNELTARLENEFRDGRSLSEAPRSLALKSRPPRR